MKEKNFFYLKKRTLICIIGLLCFALLLFMPFIYNKETAGGTAFPFIGVGIILIGAPILSLIDGLSNDKDNNKEDK